MTQGIHLKGLNGVRAIAALSVVITHIVQRFEDFGLPRMHGFEAAGYGVTMFFTLSGFLITFLLLKEKEKLGDINIKKFYTRRILRIWPLYYFYLALAVICLLLYDKEVLNGNTWFYVLLTANVPYILQTQIPLISHLWSIGVEEQFYLFWPWIVKKTTKLLKWLLLFIGIVLSLKLLFWFYYHKTGNSIPLSIIQITRFHCMAIGACGAVFFFREDKKFLRFSFSLVTQIVLWLVLALCALDWFRGVPLINDEIIALVTLFLILNVAGNPKTIIPLDNWYINYLGKISFGIYMYHPLIIYLVAKWAGSFTRTLETDFQYIVIYLLVMFLTIVIAGLSYRFFETPFLRFKDKFTLVKSSGTENSP